MQSKNAETTLKDLLKTKRLTQCALCKSSGFSPSQLSLYINGYVRFTEASAKRVKAALTENGVSKDELAAVKEFVVN